PTSRALPSRVSNSGVVPRSRRSKSRSDRITHAWQVAPPDNTDRTGLEIPPVSGVLWLRGSVVHGMKPDTDEVREPVRIHGARSTDKLSALGFEVPRFQIVVTHGQ